MGRHFSPGLPTQKQTRERSDLIIAGIRPVGVIPVRSETYCLTRNFR